MRHLARHLALACLLWSSAMPANASNIHREIARELGRLGVSIHNSWNCDPGELGLYNHRTGQLVFCSNNLNSAFLVNQTLAHEAIHVAQDCHFGTIGDGYLAPLGYAIAKASGESEGIRFVETEINPRLSIAKRRHILTVVPPKHRYIEMEAYALEDLPHFVLSILHTCP